MVTMDETSAVPPAQVPPDHEAELQAANEAVYKHSLELARLTKELEMVNRAQENLLHFISHEIKGYLAKSEAGFAAIKEGDYGEVTPELKQMATAALAEVRKGVTTVMDILDASSLKKGAVTFNKKPFDLVKGTEAAVMELREGAEVKSLKLDFHTTLASLLMEGDEEKLIKHVVRNIIDNSIKYTATGSVTVKLSEEGTMARIEVEDTGIGITPEDMANLFTEGGRGKDSIKVNVHSTGYGLYIAKQIVDAHGGTIKAESADEGKGTRFVVELPTSS